MPNSALYAQFASIIASHPIDELTQSDLLLVGQSEKIKSFYAPFEAINTQAKVVIVGICPGQQQWRNALLAMQSALVLNLPEKEALNLAKNSGAFSGAIRHNLTRLLDHIGLNERLGISSTSELFTDHQEMVQLCSALQQCILIHAKNYAGSAPSMLKNDFLKQHIYDYFIPMVLQLPNALYIPLGKGVDEVLNYISNLGYLKQEQILSGLPHPSGANAERIKYFLGEKPRHLLSTQTNADQIDINKEQLLQRLRANKVKPH
ncbi:hypothetical protein F7P75_02940 [Acinetobacter gandensis]|uniref:Uracil-DNA glycosylase-like domain-containing protein n=1 Tax=Acinetobacter gandensis TaxID=1443941 RepID=A0A1A7R711_9GAMM|nr:hypothetical protein [Acinetobacter gandensis]KAB0628747.1 hypothetical protein F7P75_02940 [Acinetobacter gandensis]OBX27661.1 hypothetical protein A9J31_08205 [Acinetobacter gandensis]